MVCLRARIIGWRWVAEPPAVRQMQDGLLHVGGASKRGVQHNKHERFGRHLAAIVKEIADISTFVVACRLSSSMPPRALVDYSSDPDDLDGNSTADDVGAHGQTSDTQTTAAAKRRRVEMPSIPSSVLQMPSLQC